MGLKKSRKDSTYYKDGTGAMLTTGQAYKPCSFAGETDLPAIAELINLSQAAYNLENRTTATKLREDFADPTFDVDQDLQLWRNEAGALVAIAELWRQTPEASFISNLGFSIHPDVQPTGLANAILAWAEQRVLALGGQFVGPIVLLSGCRDTVTARRSLLSQLGFQPERAFWRLQRSLETPIPKATFPAGWQVRSVTPADQEQWVEMFNQTFIDHWNHTPMTLEEFDHWIARSKYDPNLDLIIETPDGQMAAFAYSEISPERNTRLGLQEAHVCLLGTRRGYRRLGLARALLAESLQRLQLLGMTTATIGVDAQNPSGAVKLYQSVGFAKYQSSTVFRKTVR